MEVYGQGRSEARIFVKVFILIIPLKMFYSSNKVVHLELGLLLWTKQTCDGLCFQANSSLCIIISKLLQLLLHIYIKLTAFTYMVKTWGWNILCNFSPL